MTKWLMRLHYHLAYWLVIAILLSGILYQRNHIELDHSLCGIVSYEPK